MEDRVFNRSLFRKKTAARDKLRELGGIMASSEPLLQEAVRTIQQSEQPRAQANPMAGIMAMRQMQNRGMMGQPMAPMAQPQIPAMPTPQMPAMAQPAQPQLPAQQAAAQQQAAQQQAAAQQQPASMQYPTQPQQNPMQQPMQQGQQPQPGPTLNPMQQTQGRIGFQQGGRPQDVLGSAADAVPRQYLGQGGVDVGSTAGTVVRPINIEDMSISDAYNLGSSALAGAPVNIPQFRQEDVGDNADALNDYSRRVVSSVADPNISEEDRARLLTSAMGGNPRAENISEELAQTASKTFDKKIDSNTKIDALNRSIMGFAIAAGTSPRATQNIANGMLVGLEAMRETEQARVNAAEARARAAASASRSSRNSSTVADNMRRDIMRNITANPSNYGIDMYGSEQERADAIITLTDRLMQGFTTSTAAGGTGGGAAGGTAGTGSNIVNERPTTPGTKFRDLITNEVMIVGEDGSPQPYQGE